MDKGADENGFERLCDEIAGNFVALKGLAPSLEEAVALCVSALRAGGKILFCGNGGSAADAQHFAAELCGRFERERRGLAALTLTADTSALTAIANDCGFERVFARQIEALGRPGDVLVAISTSGRSPNVLEAIAAARAGGLKVVGMTGRNGGAMKDHCDVLLNAPAEKAARVQELHTALGHFLCGALEESVCD